MDDLDAVNAGNEQLKARMAAVQQSRICPQCGATLRTFGPGTDPTSLSEVGLKCPRCSWGMVTTWCPPMLRDQTTYTVTMGCDPRPTRATLRLLMRQLHIGVLDARTRIQQGDVVILEGRAVDVYRHRPKLDATGCHYTITPEFNYSPDGAPLSD